MGYDAIQRKLVDVEIFHGWPSGAIALFYDASGVLIKTKQADEFFDISDEIDAMRLGRFPWRASIGILYEVSSSDPRTHDDHYVNMIASNISYDLTFDGFEVTMKRNTKLETKLGLFVWDLSININNSD
ncbi:hypothetical protein SULPSESMR1_00768 [Pseudosulfitobacter pseudonitzschiae]|uniref:Uncharacterized protein n=2 Tax=Rhodobacterales TaxID=204455 RepID=A0A221JXY7_9RHOB|nr:hypothetical protein SULPSESMR1_00768 [Pseudosulfitobacter pseudonitzschiae]